MKNDLALIIPAAGRGSRFSEIGIKIPKPLIELAGRPFFWWSVESVRRVYQLRQTVFVVLAEHIEAFCIDEVIRSYYPDATVVAIPELTSGAAETAKIGMAALKASGPVAINDCDHSFICRPVHEETGALGDGFEGMLMSFRSVKPAYSYIRLNSDNQVVGTVEKQVVSPFAIAGCYLFADSERFIRLYERYKKECPYAELFVSGIFNLLTDENLKIGMRELDRHCSFGTPEEKAAISEEMFAPFLLWK